MNYSLELKNNLIKRIQEINDLNFLAAILDSSENQLFPLNDELYILVDGAALPVRLPLI